MEKQESWQPSIEQQIETKLGKEFLDNAAATTQQIFKIIKYEIAEITLQEGSSEQQKQEAEKYLAMWREFANNLFARTCGATTTSPERIQTAIEGASAFLSPESTRENDVAAKKLIKALGER